VQIDGYPVQSSVTHQLILRVAFSLSLSVAEKDGVAVLKDETYGIEGDGRLRRFFEENV
jgi:hypothetical protein